MDIRFDFRFGSDIGTTASNNTTYTLSGHFVESVTPSTIVNEGVYNAILVLKGSLLGSNPDNVAKGASAAVKAKAITLSLKSAATVLKNGITGHVVFSIHSCDCYTIIIWIHSYIVSIYYP